MGFPVRESTRHLGALRGVVQSQERQVSELLASLKQVAEKQNRDRLGGAGGWEGGGRVEGGGGLGGGGAGVRWSRRWPAGNR